MPYQAEIIRNKKVSVHDLREGEYVINEFAGQIKGVLKLNGRLHSAIFNEQTNKAPLKSESNIVINDGISDRVIIGDIGRTKDGKIYGMKVSTPGHDARFAHKQKLLVDTATSIKNEKWVFKHSFYGDIGTSTVYLPWAETNEGTTGYDRYTGFLLPYKMTLVKLMVRTQTLASTSTDLTFIVGEVVDEDTSLDTIATFTYETSLVNDKVFTINRSDFDVLPVIEADSLAYISIDASIDPHSGSKNWWFTSVWDVEVVL